MLSRREKTIVDHILHHHQPPTFKLDRIVTVHNVPHACVKRHEIVARKKWLFGTSTFRVLRQQQHHNNNRGDHDYLFDTWYSSTRLLYMCKFFFLLFSIPFMIFALLFSPSRNSDPGSHIRLFSPPTHYGSCLAFLSREGFSTSLVDLRRTNCMHGSEEG